MVKLSDAVSPKLIFSEGAAPGTPAAATAIIYAKADGLLYSKDDAGAETLVSGGSAAGGIPTGTSMPGSPSTNDLIFRTDLGLVFFYDGTRWLSLNLYVVPVGVTRTVMPFTTTGLLLEVVVPHAGVYDLWLQDFQASFYVVGGTALGASHKWVATLRAKPTATAVAVVNIDSGASDTYRTSGEIAIDALVGTTNFVFEVTSVKTGTPGNLLLWPTVSYRLVGT